MRKSELIRETKETSISVSIDLDGQGDCKIQTGIGFLDHMLTLLSFHSGIDIILKVTGDLDVDGHHTCEDIGLLMGRAIKEALGDKRGIHRYGSQLMPMDETLIQVALDISGRPCLVYNCQFDRLDLGQLDVQNIREFFKSLTNTLGLTLHLNLLYGDNDHHKAEAMFKGFAKALKEAISISSDKLQSSKGVI